MRSSTHHFGLALLVLCLLGVLGSASGVGYYSVQPGPTGIVRVTQPLLIWRIFPTPGTIVSDGIMSINDVVVQPAYSPQWGALYFVPPRPLPPGPYVVRCRIKVEDRELIAEKEKEWSFRVAEDAVVTLPLPDTSQREAYAAANAFRRKLSLPLYALDARLCASAAAHSEYLLRNRITGHEETPGRPGFTGAEPHERMEAFNYPGLSTSEDVSQVPEKDNSPTQAVQGLIDAPYHREPFLDPGMEEFGAGRAGPYTTLNFGTLRPLYVGPPRIVLSPTAGEKEVPLTFEGHEHPDPLRMHDAKAPVGYVIAYFVYAAQNPIIQVAGASLTTADKKPVPFLLNTPANDDKLTNGAFIIPVEPLKPNTRYIAAIQASTFSGINLTRTWSFTTASEKAPPAPAVAPPS